MSTLPEIRQPASSPIRGRKPCTAGRRERRSREEPGSATAGRRVAAKPGVSCRRLYWRLVWSMAAVCLRDWADGLAGS